MCERVNLQHKNLKGFSLKFELEFESNVVNWSFEAPAAFFQALIDASSTCSKFWLIFGVRVLATAVVVIVVGAVVPVLVVVESDGLLIAVVQVVYDLWKKYIALIFKKNMFLL